MITVTHDHGPSPQPFALAPRPLAARGAGARVRDPALRARPRDVASPGVPPRRASPGQGADGRRGRHDAGRVRGGPRDAARAPRWGPSLARRRHPGARALHALDALRRGFGDARPRPAPHLHADAQAADAGARAPGRARAGQDRDRHVRAAADRRAPDLHGGRAREGDMVCGSRLHGRGHPAELSRSKPRPPPAASMPVTPGYAPTSSAFASARHIDAPSTKAARTT